jgi:hypothetical protein
MGVLHERSSVRGLVDCRLVSDAGWGEFEAGGLKEGRGPGDESPRVGPHCPSFVESYAS